MQESNSTDPVSKCYKNPDVRRRIKEEQQGLSTFLRDTSIKCGKLVITVSIPSEKYTFKLMSEAIVFEFVLGKAFPYTPPRLYLKTALFQPYINDFRDLLQEVLKETWSFRTRLKDVVDKFNGFMLRLSTEANDALMVQKLGRYYLGDRFTLNQLSTFKPIERFQAFRLESDRIAMHYLVLSDTHLFVMIPSAQPTVVNGKLQVPHEEEIKSLTLFQYAEIQAFVELRINKEDSELILVLRTHHQKKLVLEPLTLRFTYRIVNARGFMTKLLKSIPKFQATDMNYETTRRDQFKPIIQNIKTAEQNLQRYLNRDNISQLNRCYQSAVEYLSGENDPIFHVYLNKITQLFLREDVKLISGHKG